MKLNLPFNMFLQNVTKADMTDFFYPPISQVTNPHFLNNLFSSANSQTPLTHPFWGRLTLEKG